MDLTFQISVQYCSSQPQTLFSPPNTSKTGHCFFFGSASSFLLELFLHSSPVAYWTPAGLGGSSFSVISFCLFRLFRGSQGKNAEVVCRSPLGHVLSELSTVTRLFWVALHRMAHSFIKLNKAVIHVIVLVRLTGNCHLYFLNTLYRDGFVNCWVKKMRKETVGTDPVRFHFHINSVRDTWGFRAEGSFGAKLLDFLQATLCICLCLYFCLAEVVPVKLALGRISPV